ncbi:MAG: hypothetical protein DMD62_11775 [Gemmatimonadetes bacterium]|nr:MAG: hypothetical protein DMD62_11775 [Gemmatimonadota bacterium]
MDARTCGAATPRNQRSQLHLQHGARDARAGARGYGHGDLVALGYICRYETHGAADTYAGCSCSLQSGDGWLSDVRDRASGRPVHDHVAALQCARGRDRSAARPSRLAPRARDPAEERSWRRHRRTRCGRQDLHAVSGAGVPAARIRPARGGRYLPTRYGHPDSRPGGSGGPPCDRHGHRGEQRVEPLRRAHRLGQRQQPPLPSVRRSRDPDFVSTAPAVVVTAPRRLVDGRERVTLNTAYVKALESAGLVPLAIPTMLAAERAAAALAAVQGLVLTGGEDVAPARYGATPHPRLGDVDPVRDAAELALIAAARARRLPVLAICRGIQILNVALGGTLYQDLDSERPGSVVHTDETSRHAVRVEPGSLLERTLGARSASVNSRHHQAIRDLAPALKAVAWAEDGVIEAAEPADAAAPWTVAVQWHPEDLTERALFEGFARAVA